MFVAPRGKCRRRCSPQVFCKRETGKTNARCHRKMFTGGSGERNAPRVETTLVSRCFSPRWIFHMRLTRYVLYIACFHPPLCFHSATILSQHSIVKIMMARPACSCCPAAASTDGSRPNGRRRCWERGEQAASCTRRRRSCLWGTVPGSALGRYGGRLLTGGWLGCSENH